MTSFDVLYKEVSIEIDDKLIGLKTFDGITINKKSKHFINRVIGSVEQKRNGVSVEDICETLLNPEEIKRVRGKVMRSQQFISKKCIVSINPDTGMLIQTNPLGGVK